jgi:hypothetical protein
MMLGSLLYICGMAAYFYINLNKIARVVWIIAMCGLHSAVYIKLRRLGNGAPYHSNDIELRISTAMSEEYRKDLFSLYDISYNRYKQMRNELIQSQEENPKKPVTTGILGIGMLIHSSLLS